MDKPASDAAKGSTYYPAPPSYTLSPPVVVQQAVVVQKQPVFGLIPVVTMCPEGHRVTTSISYKSGYTTCRMATILCFFLGPIAAAVPFFMNSMKDVEHRCPIDGRVLGFYERRVF